MTYEYMKDIDYLGAKKDKNFRFEISDYLKFLSQCIIEAKKNSDCTDEELDINYRVYSKLPYFILNYNSYKKYREEKFDSFLQSIRMEILKEFNVKTNKSAYLYCQLKFCKEMIEDKLIGLDLDENGKGDCIDCYIVSDYKFIPDFLMEDGEIYMIYKDKFDVITFVFLPCSLGFHINRISGLPNLETHCVLDKDDNVFYYKDVR